MLFAKNIKKLTVNSFKIQIIFYIFVLCLLLDEFMKGAFHIKNSRGGFPPSAIFLIFKAVLPPPQTFNPQLIMPCAGHPVLCFKACAQPLGLWACLLRTHHKRNKDFQIFTLK
jgi:hypothetical protein